MKLPDEPDIKKLRTILDKHLYGSASFKDRFGIAGPPRPEDHGRLLYLTRETTPENALVRLFLLGKSIAADAADTLPTGLYELGLQAGLFQMVDGRITPLVAIVPVDDLLFASDAFSALGGDRSRDFVVPASTHAANFLRKLTLREQVDSTLDLGSGCGIQALFAAAHSKRVVATDINEAAAGYTRFNAALNGIDNVECRTGDRFEPVAGETFDLIVSNPPFVLGPGKQFAYRDSQLELDDFCRELVAAAPAHLTNGGCLQMLFESVEIDGEAWPDRIRSWLEGTSCDAWVLHTPPVHPVHYAARRLADTSSAENSNAPGYDEWVEYFESRRVTAIHPAMVTLRKREGRNWVHFHAVAADVEDEAGRAVRAGLSACDFLDRCASDDALLEARLRLSPALKLEQQFGREGDKWLPDRSTLWMDNGLRMDAEVDMQIIAFLHQLEPKQAVGEVIRAFSTAVGTDGEKLAQQLLPVLRLFIGRGFIEPVTD